MNQEERKNRAVKLKETLARRNKTIYNKKRKKNDEYYPPKKNVKSKNSVASHNQSTTLDALVEMNGGNGLQIDISDNDNDDDGEDNFDNNDFQDDDVATFLNGNGTKEHSLPIKDGVSHRNIPNKKNSNSYNSKIEKKSVANDIENEKDSMSERVFNWVQKYHSLNMVITDAGSMLLFGNTSKSHLKQSVKVSRNNVINIDMEEDGDDNNDKNNYDNKNNYNDNDNNHNNHNEYDNHNNNNGNNNYNNNNHSNNKSNNMNSIAFKSNTESSTPSSLIITDNKIKQKQKTNVLPLFFQHQGHSRTIVGKESF